MLEVEADGRGHCTGRHIVRSAESRKEVVQRLFVHQIHHRYARAPLLLLAVKEIVVSHSNVKEIARRDAGRVVVVVLRARRGNGYQCGTIQARRAEAGRTDRSGGRRMHAAAVEPSFELLIGREGGNVHHGVASIWSARASFTSGAWHWAGYQSTVITPVEADPRKGLPRLVLQVR